MSEYLIKTNTLSGIPVILRTEDACWIPMDEANIDYQKYLAWVAEGNEAEPWEPEQ